MRVVLACDALHDVVPEERGDLLAHGETIVDFLSVGLVASLEEPPAGLVVCGTHCALVTRKHGARRAQQRAVQRGRAPLLHGRKGRHGGCKTRGST